MESIKLKNGFVVTGEGVERRDIVLRNGLIDLSGEKIECDRTVDLTGKYIMPGFVDIHTHGCELFDFTRGLYDPKTSTFRSGEEIYKSGFDKLRAKLAEYGVTGFYLTSATAPIETLNTCYGFLADYLDKAGITAGPRLFGGLMEGPFISVEKVGALAADMVLEPDIETFECIEGQETIKLVNVVPDYGAKSCKLTKYLTDKGIIVGAGHTAATCNQVADAIGAGLKYCIHFTNQTDGLYKPFEGGGAIEAVLKFDELYAELIADGYHISPAYIRDIIKRKGIERILGITDSVFVAGSNVKKFENAGVRGRVSDDGNYIAVEGKKNTLFGSNLTMNRGFENMLNWLSSEVEGVWNRRHRALSLTEALVGAVRIYSSNPCRLTGLADEGFGQIADGAKADITILDISGSQGEYKVQIETTIVGGNIVYQLN